MVRPDGCVKVLDFGLAKLTEKQTLITDSEAATVARKETDRDTVMGFRLYVTVNDACLMRRGESRSDLHDESYKLIRRTEDDHYCAPAVPR